MLYIYKYIICYLGHCSLSVGVSECYTVQVMVQNMLHSIKYIIPICRILYCHILNYVTLCTYNITYNLNIQPSTNAKQRVRVIYL